MHKNIVCTNKLIVESGGETKLLLKEHYLDERTNQIDLTICTLTYRLLYYVK